MTDPDLVAIVLAAGSGTRLRPLTLHRPKALCPVNNVALLDHALARATAVAGDVYVNAHAHAEQIVDHVGSRAHVSVELPGALDTAGAVGRLVDRIDGRAVLTLNADAWHEQPLDLLIDGWQADRIRLLVVRDPARADFGSDRYVGAALMPFDAVEGLSDDSGGMYDAVLRPWMEAGRVDLVRSDAAFFDCGTPREYHAANMWASGGRNVVGEGARVEGSIERCVVWPHASVAPQERLVGAIRTDDGTTVQAEDV